ncbi:MAG: PhoH family protein [Zetaproteobacteria bacterium]|nr:PhoH family protein [Zetaproteobacteria bacterium]
MKKIFILDTNILISDPNSIFKFEDNDVVIPISVIEEIDHFKRDQSEKGRNAREVSRILDRLRNQGSLAEGVPLGSKDDVEGKLTVYLGEQVLPANLKNNTDNQILAVGLSLQKKCGATTKVSIITKDSNLRIKADSFGLQSEDFEADKVDISDLYDGVRRIQVDDDTIQCMYAEREATVQDELLPNEFVVLESRSDASQYVCGHYDYEQKNVQMMDNFSDSIWGIYPRNMEQTFGLHALLDERIKLVTLIGGAGTGKTLLAIAAGLSKTTDEDTYQKLLVARPIIALGKDIGYLPGNVDEKLNPWMQPVYDSLDYLLTGGTPNRQKRLSKSYQELIDQGMLAVEPITYIRGRSLPHVFFVVDEAQNLTPHEVKTILTRAGEGTKMVLTGDPYQIDNPYLDSTNNGLTYAVERFKNSKISAHITFKQGERSELASLAAELL